MGIVGMLLPKAAAVLNLLQSPAALPSPYTRTCKPLTLVFKTLNFALNFFSGTRFPIREVITSLKRALTALTRIKQSGKSNLAEIAAESWWSSTVQTPDSRLDSADTLSSVQDYV